MKNLTSSLLCTLFVVLLATQAIAGGGGVAVGAGAETATKKQECPPGAMCSENYMITTGTVTPQVLAPVVVTPEVIAEKKQPTPEEVAARKATLEKALERDHDGLIKKFVHNSKSGVCMWSTPESEYYEWLIKNQDVVVNRKEFLSPTYRITKIGQASGIVFSECTTILVVHYYKGE